MIRRGRGCVGGAAAVVVALAMSSVGALPAGAADVTTTTTAPASSSTTAQPAPVKVRAKSFKFTPSKLRLPSGQPVTIQLTSTDTAHDFAVSGPGLSGKVIVKVTGKKTATGTLKLPKAGKYTFYCTLPGHRAAGMQGTITAS